MIRTMFFNLFLPTVVIFCIVYTYCLSRLFIVSPLAVHDGKVLREFEKLYDLLHIAGYYRALIYDTQVVKDTLKAAEKFIGKLGKTLSSH